MAAPPLLPYLICAIHSWRTVTYSRIRLAALVAIFAAGAIGVMFVITGAFGLSVADRSGLLWTFAIQAMVFFFAAEFLFSGD
jgi:hypothetical protein